MTLRAFIAVTALLTLAGCATVVGNTPRLKPADHPDSQYANLDVRRPAPPFNGSIYAGHAGMNLFEDNKARHVGDLVTIVLVESTAARSSAATSIAKDSSTTIAPPTLFGRGVTVGGTPILEAGVEAGRSFDGSGNSSQTNSLSGSITARVIGDLGNGNLLISGQKRLRLNQADEIIEVQGIVRVADIGTDNRVLSNRIADAQIIYGGKGAMTRANAAGWLSQFFLSAAAPF